MSHRSLALAVIVSAHVAAATAAAETAGAEAYFARHPTGHGDTVVFQFRDKVWRYDKGAAAASVVANSDAEAGTPWISPDGKSVAYVSMRGAETEVFVVELATGQVRQLTHDGGTTAKVQGWTSANEVLYSTTIKSKKRGALLFSVNTDTLVSRELPLNEASEGCVLGSDFIFVKNEELLDSNRGYRGGYAQRIFKVELAAVSGERPVLKKGTRSVLLTRTYDGVSRNPVCADGRIYFLSDKSGRYNIWSMSSTGGALVQHTFDKDLDIQSIAPLSSKKLVYSKLGEVYVLDVGRKVSTKLEIAIPPDPAKKLEQRSFGVDDLTDYQVSNDGKTLVAIARGKMWAVDVASRAARCIACDSRVRVKSPQISSDGKSIVALADRSGEYDIYRYGLGAAAAPKAIAHGVREPIQDVSLSPGDATLFVRAISGKLYSVDVASGKTLKIELASRTRPEDISWSHDGRYAAFVQFSPQDIGKVAVYDTRCASLHELTSGRNEVSSPTFSADSSEIYYISQTNFRSSVIDTWAPGNYWPAYDNKSLLFAVRFDAKAHAGCPTGPPSESARRAAPLPRELPAVAANYLSLTRHGRGLLAYSKREVRDEWGALVAVSEREPRVPAPARPALAETVFDYRASKDGRAVVARTNAGFLVSRIDLVGNPSPPLQLASISGMKVEIDLSQEREQMFQEAWRLYRDYFWDARMAGVDWKSARQKYVRFLPSVSNRAELNQLISAMVAELGAGHTTVGNPPSVDRSGEGVGKLGATFAEDGGLRVVEIYGGNLDIPEERSPLSTTEPPVEVGDRITRVNGFPVATQHALHRVLDGKVGQLMVLTVKKADGSQVDVRAPAISAAHEAWLRSLHWAWGNRQYVEKNSDSKVGYIRLSAAFEPDFASLVREYAFFHDRKALIVDLRGNSGGNIDPWVLNLFQRRTWLHVGDRHDTLALRHPRESFAGQLIVLMDGDTYSDGELIAEGVRRLGLGKLVGARTSGAGVWVNDDNDLIDGSRVRIPVSGSYVKEKGKSRLVIEGRGVTPDITVDNDPYQFYFGQDAQLDAAIQFGLKAAKASP